MSSPRVPMLSIDEAKKAASEARVSDAIAELSIFRILLRKPKLAKRVNDLLMTLLIGGDLDARLRELIIMRIGWATGSRYEWAQHWPLAQEIFGCNSEELIALRDWRARAGLRRRHQARGGRCVPVGRRPVETALWHRLSPDFRCCTPSGSSTPVV